MRVSPTIRYTLGFGAAFVGFFAFLWLVGWIARPELSDKAEFFDAKAVAAIEKARTPNINPDKPTVIQRDVDYTKGEAGAWYPKNEAPVVAGLVAQGQLPAVAERVGPEPVVVEGVEGIGKYGGTWLRAANSDSDLVTITNRLAYTTLVRWSPQGYPIVPHLAKSYTVSPDNREFVFTLRKGVKWSDGQPFTANDIVYWWKHEIKDEAVSGIVPPFMMVAGKEGTVEKIDDYHIKFSFPEPYGLFLARMATADGATPLACPEHYLKPYHPTIGDKDLIERTKKAYNLKSDLAVYGGLKNWANPEHPRLWPWIYRTYKPNPPHAFVRNPYYWMVDTRGNQLPYIDRVLFDVKSQDMVGITAANGELSMQARHIRYADYTHLMNQRKSGQYEVLHWYAGDRTTYGISPNLNLKVDPKHPATALKRELLNDKRFRQALSLAINREDIIRAEYNGQAEPAQLMPGPLSPFHDQESYQAYTKYDPARANRLLDEIGLTKRDYEGYRTFADGTRMTFFLNFNNFTGLGPAQFVVDDWAAVGIRLIPQEKSRPLFYMEKTSCVSEFTAWIGNGEYMPMMAPRYFVPFHNESNFAMAYAKWYMRGGLYGLPDAVGPGCEEPPVGHPLRRALEIYEEASALGSMEEQRDKFREILRIAGENVWVINLSTPPPALVIVKNGFRNIPRDVVASWDFQTPGNAGLETYYFDKSNDSPGAIRQTADSILRITPRPESISAPAEKATPLDVFGTVLGWIFLGTAMLLILLAAVRHPYIGRRLLIMVPTLLIISVVVFFIIQIPPGDYLTTRVMELETNGDTASLQALEDLKEMFYLEDSVLEQYTRWLGLNWFLTFDSKDRGLLQGNLGRSMQSGLPVNEIVGDRVLLTMCISIGTILFTWALAIPVGIYSAVRQYKISDYVLTFISFIGMCVPSFLLALILMYISSEWFGIKVSGLFSSAYGAQPEWTWGKAADLLKHLWVPIVVLGMGGTAGMIRIMRGNLLDELRKPYVITAMAKGMPPMRLLLKYPVRLALNPFISGIGALFPQILSGGAIVAVVLSLPTVGPLMLSALMSEDMYLAGSMLMVFSLLGVMGTLVSDLLLLWLDPRIRLKGGAQ